MRRAAATLALAAALALATARPARAQHYVFAPAPRTETLVLDTETGRVWRYDAHDDAWYVYGLAAPSPTPGATPAAPAPRRAGETVRRE